MPNNSTKMLFYSTLIGGTVLTLSSNSWMSAWMGLEINMLSFIPIMSNNDNIYTTEASMKYFLIQALASSILLFSIMTMNITKTPQMFSTNLISEIIIMTPILLKMGAAPFHWWFPSVMEGLSWTNCLILMTLQKIAPMILMMNLNKMSTWLITFILLTIMVGSIGGINQISMRKLITYSSINHMGWLLSTILINEKAWIMYFIIYSILTIGLVNMIKSNKISFINQTFTMNNNSTSKLLMFIILLSLGGLPPFLGFLPKWIIIQFMIHNELIIMNAFMIIFSLITIYYYLRISYSAFMINNIEPNWYKIHYNKSVKINSYMNIMSMTSLMIISLPLSILI
uniref:NADH dehydrogenase subunit 2 n=1 Tax=Sorineuchora formosana TaxID=3037028 RepID=UPI00279CAC50|nr:NADH dehydrogenase subunit 2 [Sorineuchora formosana]WGO57639.1 NADH dehydrogenase subunit 2 [Sorineuchora formosana]